MQMESTAGTWGQSVEKWASLRGVTLLRWSIGLVYVWFGVLKFFPGMSPAEQLGQKTVCALTLHLLPETACLFVLAAWELLLGLGFLSGRFMRFLLPLFFLHMVGTFTPFLFFPGETFAHIPYGPTLVGQYILKNLVLLSAGLVIWADLGRKRVSDG